MRRNNLSVSYDRNGWSAPLHPGKLRLPGVICIFNKGYFKKVAYEKLCANDYGLEKIANFAP